MLLCQCQGEKQMRIRSKMLVILLLPVLGRVYFAVADIVSAYRVMAAMKDVSAVTELAETRAAASS